MLIKTLGLVLRTVKYGESSIICDILTEKTGLDHFIISGVRGSAKHQKAALMQPLSFVDIVAYHKHGKQLKRIKEVGVGMVYSGIPFDIKKGAVGLFMVELIRHTVKEQDAEPSLFKFIVDSLQQLDATTNPVFHFPISFALKLTAFIGFLPHGQPSTTKACLHLSEGIFTSDDPANPEVTTPREGKLLYSYLEMPYTEGHTIDANRAERQQILEHVINYYRWHVEGFPGMNTPEIYREIWQ